MVALAMSTTVVVARYVSCILFGACLMAYGPQLWSEWRWRKVDRVIRLEERAQELEFEALVSRMDHRKSVCHPTDGTTPPSWEAYASVLNSRGRKKEKPVMDVVMPSADRDLFWHPTMTDGREL